MMPRGGYTCSIDIPPRSPQESSFRIFKAHKISSIHTTFRSFQESVSYENRRHWPSRTAPYHLIQTNPKISELALCSFVGGFYDPKYALFPVMLAMAEAAANIFLVKPARLKDYDKAVDAGLKHYIKCMIDISYSKDFLGRVRRQKVLWLRLLLSCCCFCRNTNVVFKPDSPVFYGILFVEMLSGLSLWICCLIIHPAIPPFEPSLSFRSLCGS